MALRWKINVSPSDQRDVSSQVRAMTTSVRANAEEGSVAMSTIVIDDPNGTLDVPGLKEIYGQETEAALPTFFRGIIADRGVSRGETDKSYRTTTARQWEVQVADQNERLARRVLLGVDANRPAETDVARIQYVMASPEMSTVGITSSTYVSTSGPIAMDAADYRGQTVLSLIDDCAQASGKNYWVMRRDDLGPTTFGLWYDFAGSTAYVSTIAISNVITDVDGATTFAASFDTKLTRDPSRVYSGVWMPFSGGAVYQQQASTSSNFHARDTTSYSANVKTVAKANARAIRYLTDIDTEEDRITTAIVVPNAQVNDLREGHLVYGTFSHLPGYETPTAMRVLNRTVTQVSEQYYRLDLELSPGAAAGPLVELAQLFGTASSDALVVAGNVWTYIPPDPITEYPVSIYPPENPQLINDGDNSTTNVSAANIHVMGSPRPWVSDNTFERRWTIDLGSARSVVMLKALGYNLGSGETDLNVPQTSAYSVNGSSWTDITSLWQYIVDAGGGHGWYHLWLPATTSIRYVRIGSQDSDPMGPLSYWGATVHTLDTFEVWGYE